MNKIYKNIKKFSDGVKAIDKRAIGASLTVAVLFAAVWLIYGFHINDYSNKYKSLTRDLIMTMTEKGSQRVSNEFDQKCEIMKYACRSIAKLPAEEIPPIVPELLGSIESASEFSNVVFIDTEGVVYFDDGSISRDYDVSSVVDLCDSSSLYSVFNNSQKFLTSQGGLGIIAPVVHDGDISGYLLSLSSYDSFVAEDDIRTSVFHDEVILDDKGEVVVRIMPDGTVGVPKEKHLFFDQAQQAMTVDDFNLFVTNYQENVYAGTSGRAIIDLENGRNMFIYYPIIAAEGWSIMNCYTEQAVNEQMTQMTIQAVIMFLIIVAIMIVAAIIVIRYLNRERKRVTELEYLDGLTGVYNRNAFVSHSEKVLKENKNLPYYMICFDVVNFRIINETYGHERSDVIIKAMAEACKEAFGHNEAFGRLTADVFVALTVDDGEEEERIRFIEDKVADEARKVYINHPIKMKRGRYEVIDEGESINRMIDKANIARKYINNNATVYSCQYSEELMNEARKAEEIESKMEMALANGEFKPYLQGKFNMVEDKVIGAEALVRWIRPDGSVVPPGDFIPLFEQNGFVEKIDFYMLEEICKYLRRMIDEKRDVYKVSVNQSRYLLNDPEYVNKVKAILLKYQIPVGLIELELTETVFFHEKERMIKMMNDLKKMNVNLSIDDFGSGYSSFNILKDVPFDVLKIDREFLTDSVHTEKGKWILQEIVEMAHGLGMSVICEGVENREQIDLLVSIHCHYAQGFFYARPVPLEEFAERYNLPKQG